MKTIIKGGTIVNEGKSFEGIVIFEDDKIIEVTPSTINHQLGSAASLVEEQSVIDATGCYILPGIIDDHVHFREPGLTEKADIESESRAAAAGGVTSYFDMPNTVPQTTTLEALEDKFERAAKSSHVNYSFFFGATNDNAELIPQLDTKRIPGVKLFMGSSTGNMLVDRDEALDRIFEATAKTGMPLMTHCEDTTIINRNMQDCKEHYGEDPDVRLHPLIRSEEACLESTMKAIEMAVRHQTRLHIAHITTTRELEMIPANCLHVLTAEATVGHLFFSLTDYDRLGSRIKVNPAIKNYRDMAALREGLNDGHISVIGTDHAPHLLSQKQGGCAKAASGMPMIQFSLPTMLELVDEGVITIEQLVKLMAHNPAELFGVRNRGYLRPGYKADITIVRPNSAWTVTPDIIESKCGWSPMEGHTYQWRVEKTICNGHLIYNNGEVSNLMAGEPIEFR